MENVFLNQKRRRKNIGAVMFTLSILGVIISDYMKSPNMIYSVFLTVWFGVDYIIDYINYKFEELKHDLKNE